MMKMKKALLIILILFSSCFQFAFCATDEGYGEDQIALGQFVDSFENANNITVIDDLIVNATLGCVELNYTLGMLIMENYTDYTEIDVGADRIVLRNDYFVDHSAERDEDTYLYEDYGVNYFTDFTHDFSFNSSFNQAGGIGNPWALSNYVDDLNGMFSANQDCIYIRLYYHASAGNRMILFEFENGNQYSSIWTGPTTNVDYHVRIVKSGTSLVCGVYSTVILRDAGDGTDGDVQNLSLTLQSDYNFRYIFGVNTWNDGIDLNLNYDVWNLTIGSTSSEYQDDGYFITDDYLNDTECDGSSLALMVNASIPANTDIQVQFSNDNVTWGDWEGIPLDSNMLSGGFETIDLRYLNYTDIFFMFNFSTTDGSITPRLYQARLISTIGGGCPVPSGGDGIGIIMLILICTPLLFLLGWGLKKR